MKPYILLFFLVTLTFSCNQKSKINNDEHYFTEEQEKTISEEVKPVDFLSYTNLQLDSFFQVSRDSLLMRIRG